MAWRRLILAVALLSMGALGWAQSRLSVRQLQQFIKSSIDLRHDDRKVAAYLRKVVLREQLDRATVEDLAGLGAGPKTVEALEALAVASAKLPPAPPDVPKPRTTHDPSAFGRRPGKGSQGSARVCTQLFESTPELFVHAGDAPLHGPERSRILAAHGRADGEALDRRQKGRL